MNHRYHRNFHKWFVLALFSTIIIFGIAVFKYFLFERERFKENIKRELTFIADLKKKQITAWGDERLSDINFIFNYEDVPSQIKRMKNKPTSEIGKKQMTEWMFAMFKNGHYLSMHAFDVRGDVLISIPDTSVIHLEVLQKEFENAYANRSPVYSDLQKDKEGKIVMHMVAPIKDDRCAIVGFVVLCIDPYLELYPLIQSWPVPSSTSEALLIEQVGDEILFMNELRHKEGSVLEMRLPVSNDRLPAAMAVNKGEGFVEGNDYRQVPVFAAISKINGSPWFLIVKIDKDEVYEPLYQDTRNRVIIAVLFAAVIILIGREFWSRNKLKYQQSLLAAEQERQALLIHFDYLFKYANDIIVLADRDSNIIEVNDRACQMYGYTRQEFLSMNMKDLYSQTQAKELQEQLNLFTHQESRIFESMHRHKDGTEISVEVSIRSFEIEGKRFSQSIIRDISERKEAEKKIYESEERYMQIFDSSLDAVLLTSPDGIIYSANPAACRLFDRSEEEICRIGRSGIIDVTDPRLEAGLQKRTQTGKFIGELTGVRKDGSKFPIELSSAIFYDAEGRKRSSISIRDISERKKAEKALYESEWRARALLDAIPDLMFRLDREGRFLAYKAEKSELYYQSEQDLVGKKNRDITPPGFADLIDKNIKKTLDTREIQVFEYKMQIPKRGLRHYEARMVYSGKDEVTAVVRDITDRKKSEEALKESEVHFKNLADNGQALIWASGTDKKCTFFNKPWLEFTGRKIEQELGDGWVEGVHPDDLERCFRIYSESFDKRIKFSMDYRLKHKSGGYRWIQDDGTPLYNSRGEFIGYIGHCLDITERKRIEEELKSSEERFKLAINNSPVTIFGQDKELRYTWIYHPAPGFDTASVIGKIDKDLLPEDDAKVLMEMKKRVIKEDRILRDIVRMTINGTPFYYDLTVEPTKDEDGNINGVSCASVDITERKLAEDALRERDNRLRKLSSQVPGMIYQLLLKSNGNFCVPFTSEGIKEVFGCHPEDVKDDYAPIIDAILHEDRKKVFDTIGYSAERMTPWFCEFRVRIAGQAVKWIWGRSTPERLSDGSIIWHGFISDITEEKRIEEKLRESELRFRSIYENSTIGLYRTTPAGVILMANPAMVKMLGYPSFDELAKINLERNSLLFPEKRAKFVERIEKDGELTGFESVWTRFDGKTIYVLESARAIRNSNGKTLYYDGSVEDITEQKLFEEQMKQMQRLEGLGTLASGIAHDFNNILGIILAYVTGIKRAKNDAVKTETAVDTIAKAVQRGKTLVQQILAFARKTETNIGPVNVNDIVMEIMVMILETFPKTINYQQNFNKRIPFINADRSQIHQVLLNLCVNARDAMPDGGILSINTDMVPSEYLKDKHQNITKDDYVCIEVSDTGHGMSEAVRKRIFEPFFTTKEIGKGTGLGLSVVFGVVQSHNGFIDVESQEGKGTSFKIYLPMLSTIMPVKEKKVETYEDISGGHETLLVVEDEEALLTSLQMMLDEKGYNVLTAGDGLTALNIFKEKKNEIDLVVTDFGLPGMTGLEISRQIKNIKPEQPLILATGYLDPDMKSELQRAGVMHFLFKPYDVNEVLKTVREVIDKK